MQRRFRINVDGRDYDVTVVETTDGEQTFYPDPQISAPQGSVPSAPAAPTPAPAPAAAAHPDAGPGDVACPIAGVVLSVDTTVGADVSEGQPVITLEAMKTKTIVSASKTGKVATIKISAGDPVEPGQILMTIE